MSRTITKYFTPVTWLCFLVSCGLWVSVFAAESGDEKISTSKESVWAQHRGGSDHNAVATDETIKPPLKLLWSYRCDSDTTGDAGASTTVGGGKVFTVMGMNRSVLALDADTGALLWEYFGRDVYYKSQPAYHDGRVYLWQRAFDRSELVTLDAETGKRLWSKKLTSPKKVVSRRLGPVLHKHLVLMAESTDKPSVLALDGKTGKEVWKAELDPADGIQITAPCVAGGRIFVSTQIPFVRGKTVRGAIVALDADSGKEVWRNRNAYSTFPLVSDGEVVTCFSNRLVGMKAADNQKFYMLNAKDGKEIWSVPIKSLYGATTILKDTVILKPYGSGMNAHDRKTGKQLWRFSFKGGSGCASPTVVGKHAFIGTGSFHDSEGFSAWRFVKPPHKSPKGTGLCWTLHAFDLTTQKSVWQFNTGNNVCGDVSIAYGRLYINSRDGRIYCLVPVKEGEPQPEGAKPQALPAADVQALIDEKTPALKAGMDWPMQGANPARTGIALPDVKLPLKPAWTLEIGGRLTKSTAVREGVVYAGSMGGKVVAADLKDGKKRWAFEAGAPVQCSPAVTKEHVYVGADNGKFWALNTADGKPVWTFEAGGPVQASPAVSGGIVLFGANDYYTYALNRHTGALLWKFKTASELVQAPPVIHGSQAFIAGWRDWAYALDLATGKEQWRTCIPISIEFLSVYRNKLYLRSAYQLAEFDIKTGKRLRIVNAPYGYGGVGFQKNLAYVSGGGARTFDLDKPGQPMRRKIQNLEDVLMIEYHVRSMKGSPTLSSSSNTPLPFTSMVCWASKTGDIRFTKSDGSILWKAKLGGTCHATPVWADGFLILGCNDGKLYAFQSDKDSTK